jgi:hypothetical protein
MSRVQIAKTNKRDLGAMLKLQCVRVLAAKQMYAQAQRNLAQATTEVGKALAHLDKTRTELLANKQRRRTLLEVQPINLQLISHLVQYEQVIQGNMVAADQALSESRDLQATMATVANEASHFLRKTEAMELEWRDVLKKSDQFLLEIVEDKQLEEIYAKRT